MLDYREQTVLHTPLRSTYLSVQNNGQPLCNNAEGWGPLSSTRYDLTPCALDVWVLAVSLLLGIFGGLGAILYFYKKCLPQPVKKDWHFWTKLAVLGLIFADVAVQAALQINFFPGIWYEDFRVWTTVVNLISVAVISYVQYVEHWRSRNPNGVVLFYWALAIIVYAVKLRSLVSQELHKDHVAYFATFAVGLGLSVIEFILEWLVSKRVSAYDALGDEDECPVEYANVFSILTFSWMTPMMKYGYKKYLTQDDLWNLRKGDDTRASAEKFDEVWDRQLEKKKPSLWITMISAYGMPYLEGAIIKTFSDALQFVQPQLLRLLIAFVASYAPGREQQPAAKGAAIALAMFAVSVAQTACLHQYFQRAFESGMRVKAGLTAAIYKKSMRLSNEGRASKSTGDIVNYMAVDTQRLQDLTQFGQQLWSAPFQITLCMISLYQLVGVSMFAGVGVMILMIPINGFIARISKRLQKAQMKNKVSFPATPLHE